MMGSQLISFVMDRGSMWIRIPGYLILPDKDGPCSACYLHNLKFLPIILFKNRPKDIWRRIFQKKIDMLSRETVLTLERSESDGRLSIHDVIPPTPESGDSPSGFGLQQASSSGKFDPLYLVPAERILLDPLRIQLASLGVDEILEMIAGNTQLFSKNDLILAEAMKRIGVLRGAAAMPCKIDISGKFKAEALSLLIPFYYEVAESETRSRVLEAAIAPLLETHKHLYMLSKMKSSNGKQPLFDDWVRDILDLFEGFHNRFSENDMSKARDLISSYPTAVRLEERIFGDDFIEELISILSANGSGEAFIAFRYLQSQNLDSALVDILATLEGDMGGIIHAGFLRRIISNDPFIESTLLIIIGHHMKGLERPDQDFYLSDLNTAKWIVDSLYQIRLKELTLPGLLSYLFPKFNFGAFIIDKSALAKENIISLETMLYSLHQLSLIKSHHSSTSIPTLTNK